MKTDRASSLFADSGKINEEFDRIGWQWKQYAVTISYTRKGFGYNPLIDSDGFQRSWLLGKPVGASDEREDDNFFDCE